MEHKTPSAYSGPDWNVINCFHLHVAAPKALIAFMFQRADYLLRSGSPPLLQACSAGREMDLDARVQRSSNIHKNA
jgi:hypothetical protein